MGGGAAGKIRPLKAPRPGASPAKAPGAPGGGPSASGRGSHAARCRPMRSRPRRGSPSRSLPWGSPQAARRCRSSGRSTSARPGRRRVAPWICGKACANASRVARPARGNASARARAKATRARRPLLAGWARRPPALGASASVRSRRSGRRCWPGPSGRKSVRCGPSRSGGRQHIGAACRPRHVPPARRWPLSQHRAASCGRAAHAGSTARRRAAWTTPRWRPGSPAGARASPSWRRTAQRWRRRPPGTAHGR